MLINNIKMISRKKEKEEEREREREREKEREILSSTLYTFSSISLIKK